MAKQAITIDQEFPMMAAPQRATVTPPMLVSMALDKGADIDTLERLMKMALDWEANEARKAFHQSLAAFKAEPLSITKDKLVSIKHKEGPGKTEYMHATLGNVVATIAPALGRHQLSHAWDIKREGDRVSVTCSLTHAQGYSKSITFDGPLDTSGSKNNIQSAGSTITYLERYTLLAITGLATEDQDDDAAGASAQNPHAEWLDKIKAADSKEKIDAINVELKKAFAGMPPKEVVREWQAAAKQFKQPTGVA